MGVLLFILQLFPALLSTVKQIESAVQVAKAGPAKLQLLTGVVKAAVDIDTSQQIPVSEQKLIAIIQAITAEIVALFNNTGVFKKSS